MEFTTTDFSADLYNNIMGQPKAAVNQIFPSCLHANITWGQDMITDTIPHVETPEECQELCWSLNCTTFTWVKELPMVPDLCILFLGTSLDQGIPSEVECVSGPDACSCVTMGECEIMEDNVVGSATAPDVEACWQECFYKSDCSHFNYYQDENPLRHLCVLFSSCEVIDETCDGCVFGPKECNTCDFDDTIDGECVDKCAEGWTNYEDSCYLRLTGQTDTLVYRTICFEQEGDLVSIHSEEENNFVVSLLREDSYWTWIGGKCLSSTCTWLDGTKWEWDNFNEGEPDYTGYLVLGVFGEGYAPELWFDTTGGIRSRPNTDAICKKGYL